MEADLQTAGCYDEFVEMIDDVRIARGLSFDELEELSGIARQHAQKALGPARVKTLSRMLIDALLPTLGVRIALVPDPEAIAAMQGKWKRREESNVRVQHWRCSRRVLDRARPFILQEVIDSLTAAAAVAGEELKKQRPACGPRLQEAAITPPPAPQLVHETTPPPPRQDTGRAHLRVIQERRRRPVSCGGM